MVARWADQEDKENHRFPKHNNDKQGTITWGTPESASQTKKSRLMSVIHVARSRGRMTHNLRKSCTNNAQCT
jgi:hypothetical protein